MEGSKKLSKKAFSIIFAMSLVTGMGNNGLNVVLPAIGRSTGIPDALVSAIFALSAIMWAVTSPPWARASDRHGRKPLMMIGLLGFLVSMVACGLVVSAGLRGLATPAAIFVLLLLARGLFGAFGSASNPAIQAYVAERTPLADRAQVMAGLAGAFGLGTVFGPALAPLFIFPGVGLAGPLFTFAAMAIAMLFVVWRFLPDTPVRPEARRPPKLVTVGQAKPLLVWRDPRIAPFLVYGFLTTGCQIALTQTLGFLIMDKLGRSPIEAQSYVAIAMMFGAVAGLLAQWGLIRMFQMTPRQLLRWGVAVAALGNLVIAAAPGGDTGFYAVVAGYALSSLGFGFARPGFTAGSSIAVGPDDQARVAGAIAAVNGLNIVFSPLLVFLYQRYGPLPFILNAGLMATMLVYAFSNPTLRDADPQPTTREATTMATLEKGEEGGTR